MTDSIADDSSKEGSMTEKEGLQTGMGGMDPAVFAQLVSALRMATQPHTTQPAVHLAPAAEADAGETSAKSNTDPTSIPVSTSAPGSTLTSDPTMLTAIASMLAAKGPMGTMQKTDFTALSAFMHALSAVMPPPQTNTLLALPPAPIAAPPATILPTPSISLSVPQHDATKMLLRSLSVKAALLAARAQELAVEEKHVAALKVKARSTETDLARIRTSLNELEARLKDEKIRFDQAEARWIQKDAVWREAVEQLDAKKEEVRELERAVSDLKNDVRRETGFDPENIAALPSPMDSNMSKSDNEVDSFLRGVIPDRSSDIYCDSVGKSSQPSLTNPRIKIVERTSAISPPLDSPVRSHSSSTAAPSGSRSADLRNVLENDRKRSINSLAGDGDASTHSLVRNSSLSSANNSTSSNSVAITIVERRPRGSTSSAERAHSPSFSCSTMATLSQASAAPHTLYCLAFNQNKCIHSSSSCHNVHGCLYCHSSQHSIVNCPSQRNICVTWNMSSPSASCPSSCRREHRCLRCASTSHKLINCPHPADQGLEYCFAFNAWGICRFHGNGECGRAHFCMRCMSEEHAGFKCPQNVGEYPRSVKAAVGDGSNPSTSMTVSSRDPERDSREVSGGGGGRSISSNSSVITFSLSSSEKRQSDNLQERGDDKRARNSYRSRSRSPIKRTGSVSGSSSSRAIVVEDKRTTSTRPSETNGSSISSGAARRDSTSSGGSGFSLLTHSERGSVCRDFNNNKCALVDTKCRFRHVCLRCGDSSHQEKRCPHISV
ncbi:hypothetical protein BJ741DRAFT_617809 [Chytriomyces cf. hyalinus JEL632]|nr:hypothetical protein BJ741DRAFT_617809 [Chytriomyces cf. hyalinus JEL632]